MKMLCNKCFIEKECPSKDIIKKCCEQCDNVNDNEFIDSCKRLNERHNYNKSNVNGKLKVNLKLKQNYTCFDNNNNNNI